jgi:Reverse transcriptase (RNA-dependent DNA polymerase)
VVNWLTPPADAPELPILIVGDLNARIGSIAGDHDENTRGHLVHGYLTSVLGLQRVATDVPVMTFLRPNGDSSVVDHAYTSIPAEFVTLSASPAHRGQSDHFILVLTVAEEAARRITSPLAPALPNTRLRMDRFDEDLFHQALNDILEPIHVQLLRWQRLEHVDPQEAQRFVDMGDRTITSLIMDTAVAMCGTSTGPSKKGPPKPPDLKAAIRRERSIGQRVGRLNASLGHVPFPALTELQEAQAARRTLEYEWRQELAAEMREAIKEGGVNAGTKRVATIARCRRRTPVTLAPTVENLEGLADRFRSVSALPRDVIIQANVRTSDPDPAPPPIITPTIVSEIVRRLAKAKAPGPSGVTNALIRGAPRNGTLIHCLSNLFSLCRRWGVAPETWKEALVVPVPKKGNTSSFANFRPISLTETFRKVFEKCVLRELQDSYTPDISQGGFRAQRCTIDQVAALNEALIQRASQLGLSPLLAFLDITAAYDTVSRQHLYNMMAAAGIAGSLIRTIQALFDSCRSRVSLGGRCSGPYVLERGLLQGSSLSPALYTIFLDGLLRSLRQKARWSMGGVPVSVFAYADDIALLADDPAHLAEMLSECDAHATELGFQFAPAKCEIISPPGTDVSGCTLHGQPLKSTDSFIYLGVDFTIHGVDPMRHAKRLRTKAIGIAAILTNANLGAYGIGGVLAASTFITFVRPILEYGLQLGCMQSVACSILEAGQHRCLTMLLGIPSNSSKLLTAHLAAVPSMRERAIELSARWTARRRLLPDDGTFMVQTAQAERDSREGKRHHSCLRMNPEACELADRLEETRVSKWRETILARRGWISKQQWEASPALQQHQASSPGLTLRQIGLSLDRSIEMVLLRLASGSLHGATKQCRRCNAPRVTARHLRECLGSDFAVNIAHGELLTGSLTAARALHTCLGRENSHLTSSAARSFSSFAAGFQERMHRRHAEISPEQLALRPALPVLYREQTTAQTIVPESPLEGTPTPSSIGIRLAPTPS